MFRAKNVQCSCSLTPRNCLSTALYIRTPFTHFKAQIDSICQILNIVIKMTVNYMPTKLTTNIHHLRSHMQWQTIQYTTIDIHTPAHACHSISICLITNGLVTSNTTPSSSIKMILISSPMRLHFSMVSLCFFSLFSFGCYFRCVLFTCSPPCYLFIKIDEVKCLSALSILTI